MDTEYILGCSLELAEITALEHTVLSSTLGAYDAVRSLVDNDRAMPDHFLQNTAGNFLDNATQAQQHFFALCAVPALDFSLKAFKERAEHLVQTTAQRDLGLSRPTTGLFPESELLQPGSYVQRESDINEGLVRTMLGDMFGNLTQRWSRDLQMLTAAVDWYCADGGQAFNAMLVTQQLRLNHAKPLETVVSLASQAQRSRERRLAAQKRKKVSLARAAIKKATKLFQSLGQERNLTMLVSGAEVTLQHPDSTFKFVLRPPEVEGWLVDRTQVGRTHTPYEIRLFTKDDVYLSRLCVYFDDTPVLDQLLALTLFVQSGEEARVLEKANWFGLEDWSAEKAQRVLAAYPQLADKLPRKLSDEEKARGVRRGIVDVYAAERAHWEPYEGRVEQWVNTWMEPAKLALSLLTTALRPVAAQLEAARQLERENQERACRQLTLREREAIAA